MGKIRFDKFEVYFVCDNRFLAPTANVAMSQTVEMSGRY